MKIAEIFISGMKYPIKVEEKEGKRIQSILNREEQYANIGREDTINIGRLWTGKKKDVKYVNFINHSTVQEQNNKISFSEEEMESFEKEIRPYCIDKDDKEYEVWVEKYLGKVLDVKNPKPLLLSPFSNKRILSIRNKLAPFKEFEEWKKDKKQDKTSVDNDLLLAYKKEKEDCQVEILLDKTDEIREECKKIVQERFVGRLTMNGRLRFLKDRNAVKLNEDGKLESILKINNSVPYNELIIKLIEYKKRQEVEIYKSDQVALQYEEIVNDASEIMKF